ncbi:MAG: hypothetical protein Rhob2KO_47110 [Rhodopirellula baltica]
MPAKLVLGINLQGFRVDETERSAAAIRDNGSVSSDRNDGYRTTVQLRFGRD